jgi:cell division protein FtsN
VLPKQDTVDVAEGEGAAPTPPVDTAAEAGTDAVAAKTPPIAQNAPEKTPAADASRYLLQAGSFERSADADDLKARIALSGEPAHVEQAEVNGKTMYRVRLGPYADVGAANAAKANLAGQGINAVNIKIK